MDNLDKALKLLNLDWDILEPTAYKADIVVSNAYKITKALNDLITDLYKDLSEESNRIKNYIRTGGIRPYYKYQDDIRETIPRIKQLRLDIFKEIENIRKYIPWAYDNSFKEALEEASIILNIKLRENLSEEKYNDVNYWFNPDDGTWNPTILVNGKKARLRAGIIIVKDGSEILLGEEEQEPGVFSLPGGAIDKGETEVDTAVREAQEEVHIKVKNAKYTEIDYCVEHDDAMPWVKEHIPEKEWWYHYYTKLVIADYDDKYEGKIADEHEDPILLNTSKFYKFEDVINEPSFKPEWKKALIKFGYLKDNIKEFLNNTNKINEQDFLDTIKKLEIKDNSTYIINNIIKEKYVSLIISPNGTVINTTDYITHDDFIDAAFSLMPGINNYVSGMGYDYIINKLGFVTLNTGDNFKVEEQCKIVLAKKPTLIQIKILEKWVTKMLSLKKDVTIYIIDGDYKKFKSEFIAEYNTSYIINSIQKYFISGVLEELNESKADEQNLIDFAGDSLAKRFLSIKSRLKSPENDIYYWLKKTPIELEDRVNEIESTVSKTKQKEIQKTEGAELVAEENGWKVYRIDSYEASCLYGKGTRWCTASTETSSHFNDYKKKGIKFYYFIKDNEKYALALYPKIIDDLNSSGIKTNYELYDAKDTVIIDSNQIKSLNLPEIPGIKLTFEVLPTEIEGNVLVKVYPYNQGEFVIPSSVTSIGESAFSDCLSLTSITIPNSVTKIGESAFYGCSSLTSITIPNSVTSIGERAFYNCKSLKSITIPNSVTSIGGGAFSECTSLTSITIPNSVTSIGNYAFYNCKSLKSITIPNSVTSIGGGAFYNCKSLKSITLPNSVTEISAGAFLDCRSLTSITIPNSVTSIGYWAFSDCESLTSITIPNSVTSISNWAFDGCTSLTSITIPNSVTSIGYWAFSDCESLTSITIPNSVTSIGKSAFSNCRSLTIYAEATSKPAGWDADWNPNNRPVVWNYKNSTNSNNINESKQDEQRLIDFAGDSLAKRFLSIKNKLKSPENDIYYWLKKDIVELEDRINEVESTISKTKQKEIEKTEGAELVVEENGWKAYRIDTYEASCLYGKGTKWCTASKETSSHFNDYKKKGIKFYYFIKDNEKYALALYPETIDAFNSYGIKSNYEIYDTTDKLIIDPNQIKSLNLPEIPGVELILESLPTKIENGVLVKVYPYNQGEFVIPNNVTKIGNYAFYTCTSLTSIIIPNSVTSIGSNAFFGCNSLTSITIPNSVTEIGSGAFFGCNSLTSITIPNNLTKIGEEAFYNCTSLTSIIIPNSVTEIGKGAFSGCTSLTSITIPNNITSIGSGVFDNCESLTSITIPNSVTSIGEHAFFSCKSLTSITIPNSVTSIGSNVFYNCTSLTSITIPNSVTKIGKSAFYNCTSLTIYAEATSKPAGWDADWNPNKRPVKWGYKVNKIKESYNESFKESLDIKSKTLLDAIEEVFECSYEPVHGATYLLPNGKFVNLDKYFKLHQEYDYEFEFAYHGMIQEILSPYFNILNEEEDPLLNEGCIRLNDAYEDAYCYIQLSEKISPTNTQYTSLAEWVNNLNNNIYLQIGTTQIVKGYNVGYKENQVSAEEIIKEIRQYYVTGRLGRLEEKLSKEQLPKYLYHATYGPYFEQIKRDGAIKIKPPHKNWIFNNEYDNINAIYLAGDSDVAISYAETSETAEEELLENIILLTIDTSKLDLTQLNIDHNVKLSPNNNYNKEALTYEYYKDIPLTAIMEREHIKI